MATQHTIFRHVLLVVLALPLAGAAKSAEPETVIATSQEQQEALKLAAENPVALLNMLLERCDRKVRDYTGVFVKQERLDGKLTPVQKVAFKFRQKPHSVYIEWLENPLGASKLLYVQGRHDGNMLVHPAGIMGFIRALKVAPEGKQALKSTLRPVTMFGFRANLDQTLKVFCDADKKGDLRTGFSGPETVAGRRYLTIERFLPPDKYDTPKLTIRIDLEYLLPTRITTADAQGDLIGHYTYTDLKFNVGLTEKDFDPKTYNLN